MKSGHIIMLSTKRSACNKVQMPASLLSHFSGDWGKVLFLQNMSKQTSLKFFEHKGNLLVKEKYYDLFCKSFQLKTFTVYGEHVQFYFPLLIYWPLLVDPHRQAGWSRGIWPGKAPLLLTLLDPSRDLKK